MAKTKTKIETKAVTYKGEKAYQKGMQKMLADGWHIQSETMTEHRGAAKWLTLGIGALILPKKRKYHVMYIRGEEQPEAGSATARLAELDALKDSGAISDDEYTRRREEIIASV